MRPKSSRPNKQRKYQFSAEKNENHKLVGSHLTRELKQKKGFRSLPVRQGDIVKVMRGDNKGLTGKVNKVDPVKQRVYVDKVVKKKTDNTEFPVPIHPSNLLITKFAQKDRKRLLTINRKIKNENEKIDIDATLAEEEEEEDVIDIDDEELENDKELDQDLDEDLEDEDLEIEDDQEEEEA